MDLLIRFYSNENLDADLVQAIREFGYDVLTSYEANQAKLTKVSRIMRFYNMQLQTTVVCLRLIGVIF